MYASSTFVGNSVGNRKKETAKFYAKLTFFIAFGIELVIVAFLNFFSKYVTEFYTTDEDVMPLVMSGLHYMSINSFMQGLGATITGVMRGVGKQKVGLVNTFIGNYFAGLPLAYLLCFNANMELGGLWLGCAIGVMTSVTLNVYYLVNKADWDITDKKMLMRRM